MGTYLASCPIKRTMISSNAPSTARVCPSSVPSPHPTPPSSSVILTKSHRGLTLKYSISLIGAMSIALAIVGVSIIANAVPSTKVLRLHIIRIVIGSSQKPILDSVMMDGSVLWEPRRSAWGYPGFIWGPPVSWPTDLGERIICLH